MEGHPKDILLLDFLFFSYKENAHETVLLRQLWSYTKA